MQNNNFFSSEKPIESIEKSLREYLWERKYFAVPFFVLMLALEFVFAIYIPQLIAFPLFAMLTYVGTIQYRIEKEFLKQFARANNFLIKEDAIIEGFEKPANYFISNVICGRYLDYPITLFNLNCGKKYAYTVFDLKFDEEAPTLFLKKKSSALDKPIFIKDAKMRDIELEGNFNDYFDLQIEEGYQIGVLQILAPNFMEDLIDKAEKFSLETVGRHVYIYAHKQINTKTEIYGLYRFAELFIRKIGPVLMRMRMSKIAK